MTDICFVLEGTYPYKTGGVSAWVDALVAGLPDLTFSVAHLFYGERPSERRYSLPANVREIVDISLNAPEGETPLSIGLETLLDQVPASRIYHPLSTGFAGYLGTALKQSRKAPMIVTEHGLYWHEAELGVGELECGFKIVETESGPLCLGRTWESWSATFRTLALDAYAAADVITTVCEDNRRRQIGLGADALKVRVIENGVPVPPRPISRALSAHPHCALVGRVAPMKDIKTYIHMCSYVQTFMPHVRWSVIGPTSHDLPYFGECRRLADELGIRNFTFTGETDMRTAYPSIDCVVLTSVSEAQPLALLEAMSYGIPVVATAVGGVPEIVASVDAPPSGLVVPAGDFKAAAHAVMRLLNEPPLYRACSDAGRARVEAKHSSDAMIDAYRALYHSLLTDAAW